MTVGLSSNARLSRASFRVGRLWHRRGKAYGRKKKVRPTQELIERFTVLSRIIPCETESRFGRYFFSLRSDGYFGFC